MEKRILDSPHDCYLILTEKCNMKCLHCYGSYGEENYESELDGTEWERVIYDLKEEKVFYINISGGEPTCHKDFCQIMEYINYKKMYFIITTNGVCSEEAILSIIKCRKYLLGLKISLDGSDAESHAFLRRNKSGLPESKFFLKTMNTIRILKENGIPFTIATCIHKGNIQKLYEMLELIISISPTSWFISTIAPSGRAVQNFDVFVSDKDVGEAIWQDIKSICEKNNIFVQFIDMEAKSNNKKIGTYKCPAASWFCEISSTGVVSPCPLARVAIPKEMIKFDNIKRKKLKQIWDGKAFRLFRELSKKGCYGCKEKENCERCIPQSIRWFGSAEYPTPYCVKNGKELGLKNYNCLQHELQKKIALLKNNAENNF